MDNFDSNLEQVEERKARPTFLTVLCILTFLYTGLTILSSVGSVIAGKPGPDVQEEMKVRYITMVDDLRTANLNDLADVFQKLGNMEMEMVNNYPATPLVALLCGLLGFAGAMFMWRGRKLGFHLYIIYSIAIVSSVYLLASSVNVSSFYIIVNFSFAGILIFLYSLNLKWLQ